MEKIPAPKEPSLSPEPLRVNKAVKAKREGNVVAKVPTSIQTKSLLSLKQ